MSDEQQLNSVERFRKQPGRLVLEEHSHCEVPAGCGGVVLRWRNPLAAVPLTARMYSPAQTTFLVDGTAPPSARFDLAPGRHVFGFVLDNADLSAGLLVFVAAHEPRTPLGTATPSIAEPLRVLSDDDSTWRGSLDRPSDNWGTVGFDDRTWLALVKIAPPQLEQQSPGMWALHRCTELGAACLGLPPSRRTGRGTVWVRKVFEIAVPQELSPS